MHECGDYIGDEGLTDMNVTIRHMEESDFHDYIRLQQEVYFDKTLLETDEQKKYAWDGIWHGKGCYYAIMGQESGTFLGYCAIKNKGDDIPEISIELLNEYHRKGVGYRAVRMLMREIDRNYNKNVFYYKVEPDNYASLLLVRKLKGIPHSLERNICLDDEYVSAFETAMKHCIDENLEKIAAAFKCDVLKLLSNVLVFKVEYDGLEDLDCIPSGNKGEEIHSDRKISSSIRVFGQYMLLDELINILEHDSDKLDEFKLKIEQKIEMLQQRLGGRA